MNFDFEVNRKLCSALAKASHKFFLKRQVSFNLFSSSANFAFISMIAAKTLDLGNEEEKFVRYARSQIDYMLGNNNLGISYVIGYGNNFPRKPHHRAR